MSTSYGYKLEEENVLTRGYTLTLTINCPTPTYSFSLHESKTTIFELNEEVIFQMKADCEFKSQNNYNRESKFFMLYIRFEKIPYDHNTNRYEIIFSSPELMIQNKCLKNDDGTWYQIYSSIGAWSVQTFQVKVHLKTLPAVSCGFEPLHNDDQLTDFKLKGENCSVNVHRAVLASCSPVLQRMIKGTWRETAEGSLEIPGITKATLQHFKDYMYLHTLPNEGLEHLILLASYYIMPNLEQSAVNKITENITAEVASDLLDFAAIHKLRRLQMAILKMIQRGLIKVSQMEKYYLGSIKPSVDDE